MLRSRIFYLRLRNPASTDYSGAVAYYELQQECLTKQVFLRIANIFQVKIFNLRSWRFLRNSGTAHTIEKPTFTKKMIGKKLRRRRFTELSQRLQVRFVKPDKSNSHNIKHLLYTCTWKAMKMPGLQRVSDRVDHLSCVRKVRFQGAWHTTCDF